jgi:hypothetical protein
VKFAVSSSRRLAVGCLFSLLPLMGPALAVNAPQPDSGGVPTLLREMSGTWSVKEWMWAGPGAKAIDLPAAVAHRNLIDGKFLQESMTALPGAGAAFNRISYFDYNPVSGQYEYFSLDTRAPQMMNERSVRPAKPDEVIELYGSVFVATQWGSATNVPFRYRLNVGPIHGNTQMVELYLTPMGTVTGREFLAFKYLYTRGSAG